MLEQLAERITAIERPHPLRVGIDGVDAAGKTTLADELVAPIEARGRPAIRASIDGFHRPRAERYRLGPHSPEGYYRDSFDYAAVRADLLAPLGPGGDRRYRRAAFDWRRDLPVHKALQEAPPNAVLLFDGIFLLHPQLRLAWDYHVFVQVAFKESLRRALLREGAKGPAATDLLERYLHRYIPGQRLYLESAHPQKHAHVVLDNNDPDNPRWLTR